MKSIFVCVLLCLCTLMGCRADPSGQFPGVTQEDTPGALHARFEPEVWDIVGWKVYIEPALLESENQPRGHESIAMLRNHLERIRVLVPEPALSKLQQVGIWIEVDHPLTDVVPGPYHCSPQWLAENGYDVRMGDCVHVTRADSLLDRQQMLKHPMVILHELAHAYHDQFMPEGYQNKRILQAYRNAMDKGLYDRVLDHKGRTVKAYATTNQMEYFAEATEAYFYRNDFYPFVRAELKEHDPVMHDLLVEIWGPLK